jgi:hypothetical protein
VLIPFSPVPMGDIPSTSNMITTMFTEPVRASVVSTFSRGPRAPRGPRTVHLMAALALDPSPASSFRFFLSIVYRPLPLLLIPLLLIPLLLIPLIIILALLSLRGLVVLLCYPTTRGTYPLISSNTHRRHHTQTQSMIASAGLYTL